MWSCFSPLWIIFDGASLPFSIMEPPTHLTNSSDVALFELKRHRPACFRTVERTHCARLMLVHSARVDLRGRSGTYDSLLLRYSTGKGPCLKVAIRKVMFNRIKFQTSSACRPPVLSKSAILLRRKSFCIHACAAVQALFTQDPRVDLCKFLMLRAIIREERSSTSSLSCRHR